MVVHETTQSLLFASALGMIERGGAEAARRVDADVPLALNDAEDGHASRPLDSAVCRLGTAPNDTAVQWLSWSSPACSLDAAGPSHASALDNHRIMHSLAHLLLIYLRRRTLGPPIP